MYYCSVSVREGVSGRENVVCVVDIAISSIDSQYTIFIKDTRLGFPLSKIHLSSVTPSPSPHSFYRENRARISVRPHSTRSRSRSRCFA